MNYFIIVSLFMHFLTLLTSLIYILINRFNMPTYKYHSFFYLILKLSILLPSGLMIWLLYGYLYLFMYYIDMKTYLSIPVYYFYYLVLICFYLFIRCNHRRMNSLFTTLLVLLNLYCLNIFNTHKAILIQFLPQDDLHQIFVPNELIGNRLLLIFFILNLVTLLIHYLYDYFNKYELTD